MKYDIIKNDTLLILKPLLDQDHRPRIAAKAVMISGYGERKKMRYGGSG